jgi:hypothetical protein
VEQLGGNCGNALIRSLSQALPMEMHQLIAGFHFGYIEQGGSSLYAAMSQKEESNINENLAEMGSRCNSPNPRISIRTFNRAAMCRRNAPPAALIVLLKTPPAIATPMKRFALGTASLRLCHSPWSAMSTTGAKP